MIESVAYDKTTERLEVEFKGGGVYQYANVPAATVLAMLTAESIGSYFTQNIKGKYQYVKVAARGKDESAKKKGRTSSAAKAKAASAPADASHS
jgi:hypothetical protein